VAGVHDVADPFALAHLPRLLPATRVQLDPASPRPVAPAVAWLGWGLGSYRFERYLKPGKALAQLRWMPTRCATRGARAAAPRPRACATWSTPRPSRWARTSSRPSAPRWRSATARSCAWSPARQLLAQNFPAIHAVGRATHRRPRLIELTWGDARIRAWRSVGKGVCFDTGGLNIKSADGMRHMKKDMGGAAHAHRAGAAGHGAQAAGAPAAAGAAVENAIGPRAIGPAR
jgi:leucyl aminopeptidase